MSFSSVLLLGTLLVVGLAIFVATIPANLYEKNYVAKAQAILNLENDRVLFGNQNTSVLVTGADESLGMATIQHLVERATTSPNYYSAKLTVIMACQSMERCQAAQQDILQSISTAATKSSNNNVELIPLELDLASRTSIEQFAVQLQTVLPMPENVSTEIQEQENENDNKSRVPPLHVMIHNAAVCAPYSQLQYDPQHYNGVETHYHVNYLGHALLTHLIFRNVLAVHAQNPSQKARWVTLSTASALLGGDPMLGWYDNSLFARPTGAIMAPVINGVLNGKQYARSKQGQLLLAAELQTRYPESIATAASHPGYTRYTGSSGTNNYLAGFPSWLKYAMAKNPIASMSPSQGALTTVLAVLDPTAQYVGPSYFLFGTPVVVSRSESLHTGSVHHKAFSREATQQLWDHTMTVLGIAKFGEQTYQTR